MDKSPDAFRTISEVADALDTPAHVLRFWESRFPQIKPVKRAGGRRYYRPSDVALLTGIKRLLHDEGLTIRGVQKILRDQGVRHVAGLMDDSVGLDELLAEPTDADGLDDTTIPEAAFIAIDDPEPEPPANPVRMPGGHSGLPLFDAPFDPPPALARPDPPKPALRKPTLRDDTTFSSVIRGLPRGSLRAHRSELADLARKLSALRNRVAERAEGGNG